MIGLKIEDYKEISEEYSQLQMGIENHKTRDYHKLLLEQKVEKRNLKLRDIFLYYSTEILIFFLKCVVFLFPIVCGIIYWLIKM